jgi:ABC-type Fe3+-siderophore transport system permease subunit
MGMAINVVITAVVLLLGLSNQWSGIPTAALAFNLAAIGEIFYLGWRTQRVLPLETPLLGKAIPAAS